MLISRQFYLLILTLTLSSFVYSQNFLDVSNVTRYGNFNCGADPTITAQVITSEGSSVVDGALVITDPCGFTTVLVSMQNLRYNQPGANWPHGFFFPEGEGVSVTSVNLPAGWIYQDSCTGASCSAQETGGVGFYYDASAGSSCTECWPTINDGIPNNNYGQSSMSCNTPFTIEFEMTFCNSKVETAITEFTLRGTSDGNTGCWSTHDLQDNRITFELSTVESETPLYDVPAWNPEVITQCFDGGLTMNYIAVLEAECGTGDHVTWWDAMEGGNLIGTGSPFMYDPPGDACPGGQIVYASCCPDGEGCERQPVTISHCSPPMEAPLFDEFEALCPGAENPLPNISLDGATGTWSPEFDPYNSGTYTFVPDPGQCATLPVQVDIEILPYVELSFNEVGELCQNSTPPPLPAPNEGYNGTWFPETIDTSTPGTYIYTFTPDDACALDATIEVVINEEVIPEFNNLQNVYCQFDDVAELPNLSDNGYNGTWSPALIDSSTPGTYTYTFTPDVPDCFQAFSIDIVIEETIIPTFNPVPPLCQFETGAVLPSPIEGVNGTWFPATIDTSTPGIYEYTFTPEGQCSEAVTIEIEITEEIVPEFNLPNTYCQGEDPIALESISDNGVNGTWFPATIDTSTPGTFTYTFTPQGSLCANEINLVVQIQETPSLNSLPVQFLCDEDFDGIYETNLNDLSPSLGGGSNVNYTYYASMADLNSGISIPGSQLNNYQFDALPATIYVVGTSLHGCESQAVPIVFNEADSVQHNPGPFTPLDFCPEDAVDITQYETMISSAMGVDFEYYPTFNDARNQTSMITDPESFVPGNNQTSIFVRLNAAGACSAIVELQLNKLPSPVLELMNQAVICPDTDLEVTATSDMHNVTFVWTLPDGSEWNGASQVITEAGTYSVTAYSADGCRSETRTLTVKNPTTPTIVSVDISGSSIIVGANNNGEGPMEYSLDGVFWQSNNRFDNLIPGETYMVYVRSSGCMVTSYEVTVIFFPNFLSPNDDGVNDTWAIRGIESDSGATIKIFDRYGKIFVDTVFQGEYEWNGKYMGRSVASGDYWYIINVPGDGVVPDRKFTGHVTVRNQ